MGDGEVNAVACLENTETSAIGRALANLGFLASRLRPSAEEVAKAALHLLRTADCRRRSWPRCSTSSGGSCADGWRRTRPGRGGAGERCRWAELGVAAGTGRELFDEPCELWVALAADLVPGRYVALRVVGDSMVPLLHSGDLVLVDLDGTVHPGAVAVARHPEHGYVVKRVGRRGERALSLVSLNRAYPPLELLPGAGALLGPVVLRWCGHGPAKPRLATRP